MSIGGSGGACFRRCAASLGKPEASRRAPKREESRSTKEERQDHLAPPESGRQRPQMQWTPTRNLGVLAASRAQGKEVKGEEIAALFIGTGWRRIGQAFNGI
jgi:hypothetical protein